MGVAILCAPVSGVLRDSGNFGNSDRAPGKQYLVAGYPPEPTKHHHITHTQILGTPHERYKDEQNYGLAPLRSKKCTGARNNTSNSAKSPPSLEFVCRYDGVCV